MSSGGKGGGGGGGSLDYYGSVVGLLGWGPADELVALVIDDKEVWRADPAVRRSSSANPFVFDVDGYGRAHFYWGTTEQVSDDPVTTGRQYPGFRRRVWIVLEQFLFGRERTSAPDVKVVWRRRPRQEVIAPTELDGDGQANSVAFALEVLTSRLNGVGLSSDLFDARSWQRLADAQDGRFLTPTLSERMTGRNFLQELADYIAGWLRPTDEGRIEIGSWRDVPDAAGLPVVRMADLVAGSKPRVEAETAVDADSRVTVTFRNREQNFQEDQAVFNNSAQRAELERDDATELQRPWVRRGDQAGQLAAESGELLAQPGADLRLEMLETRAAGLVPGERFIFERDDLDWSSVWRVTGRTGDGDDQAGVRIEAERERRVTPGIYAGGASATEREGVPPLQELKFWQPIQLPASLAGGRIYQLATLAARTQGLVSEGRAYLQAEEVDEWQLLGTQRTWAVAFELAADYPATIEENDVSGELRLARLPGVIGFDDLDAAPTMDEIADDAWVMAIFSETAPERPEFLTVRAFGPAAEGGFSFSVWRARFGSTRRSFGAGDRAFVFRRAALRWFTWTALGDVAEAAGSVRLALAPSSAFETFPLADVSPKVLELRDQRGESATAELEANQTELQQQTSALAARVRALEEAEPPPAES